MTARRLDRDARIDRGLRVDFAWDGRNFQGYSGDTLASALLANDVSLIGRSFKYHRPRGVMSAGPEEAGAIVTIGTGARATPNLPASTAELRSDLEAFGQNAWPDVRRDRKRLFGLLGGAFSAGFYYKTFMGSARLRRGTSVWMAFEKLIRRAAGMGAAPKEPDPDSYETMFTYCDTLVIGGGRAGLVAAREVAERGEDVLLLEQDSAAGGKLLSAPVAEAEKRRAQLVEDARAVGVQLMTRTTAFGIYDNMTVGAVEIARPDAPVRQRSHKIVASRIVLATGAIERFLVFGNNDLPGIMTVSSARAYLNRFAVLVGKRILIATNNDSVYQAARELVEAGAEVTICDSRKLAGARLREIAGPIADRVLTGHRVVSARGRSRVRSANIMPVQESREPLERLACDAIIVSGGWNPTVQLLGQRGVKMHWDDRAAAFLAPDDLPEGITLAGSVRGRNDAAQPYLSPEIRKTGGRAFVDPINDVTVSDIVLARQEGFGAPEHVKRYTTLGMGPNQGKIGNVEGALVMRALGTSQGEPMGSTTTARPPFTPVALGALAGAAVGKHFVPTRRLPLHDWHLQQGGVMTEAGPWLRPWWYASNGADLDSASYLEARVVRERVGLCDVSTLGKIEILGPDSATFINRVFANAMKSLAVGKARYGILLRDDGIVMDDGVIQHLEESRYLFTTTTANSGEVLNWLEELLQTRWPDLMVHISSMTDQWAVLALAGPRSTEVLARIVDDRSAIATARLPFMGITETTFAQGVLLRVVRVSFSGERAYELYVGAHDAKLLAERALASLIESGGVLYGLEALDVLRIEKGHVSDGEIDGRTTMADLGLSGMASLKKDYIGRVLSQRPALIDPERPTLVGVKPKKAGTMLRGGAILMPSGRLRCRGCGWLTTAVRSPAVDTFIALGFVEGGLDAWKDSELVCVDPLHDECMAVELVSPCFVDPEGVRIKADDA